MKPFIYAVRAHFLGLWWAQTQTVYDCVKKAKYTLFLTHT